MAGKYESRDYKPVATDTMEYARGNARLLVLDQIIKVAKASRITPAAKAQLLLDLAEAWAWLASPAAQPHRARR